MFEGGGFILKGMYVIATIPLEFMVQILLNSE